MKKLLFFLCSVLFVFIMTVPAYADTESDYDDFEDIVVIDPEDFPEETPVNAFTDVSSSAYYAGAVNWAVENNITSGTSKTAFSPNASCTRAQMVTFLWRAANQPEPASFQNPFVDVKEGDYFYKAVLWAVEKGITSGTDSSHFAPQKTCTRGEAVTFLWRTAGKPEPVSASNPFVDVKSSSFFYKSTLWASEQDITSGTDSSHFSPNGKCTRAQTVTFLYRYMG